MNRVLIAIGGLLVGLLAILFAAPAMVDWNRYRGMFEEEATRLLGREVRVGGRVNMRLLPVPYVRFEQVRVADTTASVGRPLFAAEDFTVWLSVGALLSGGIEATDIELRRPSVTLVLDGKGGGSWTALANSSMPTGFVPAKVAFEAVRIADGKLSILGPDGVERVTFERINGELSAQALEGPYRIATSFTSKGEPREFRLSTAAPEGGAVRFKATVRDARSGVSYSLDGAAHDVLKSVRVTGELTARLPLPGAMLAAQAAPGTSKPGDRASNEFDLRADLKGDTTGFDLNDLSLSFEQDGRPQIATGDARVRWTERTDIAVNLKSSWLDLDRIAGAGTGASALELTQGVASAVSRVLESEGRTKASLLVEQATLGADVVSGLAADLEHAEGQLNIKSLTASLPGGARITAAGAFEGKGADLRYAGRINLRGASLARFAAWASKGQALPLPARDGAFTIVGNMSLGAKELAARNLSLEIGRNMLTGDASWKAGQPQQIVLSLEGSELDLTPIVPQGAEPVQGLRELVAGIAGVKPAASPAAVGAADAEIRVRVDRLVVGPATYRDAVAELKLIGGSLSMPQLRLASPEGYAVELRGDISDLARPNAKGALTGLLVADTPAGLSALARATGLPPDLVPTGDEAAPLVPLRVAGRLSVGLKGPDTHDIVFDGTLADSRIAGTARLGAQKAVWRDRSIDLSASVEGRAIAQQVARRLGSAPATSFVPSQAAKGGAPERLQLRIVGTPISGVTALMAIDGEGLMAEYRGRAVIDDTGNMGLEGDVTISLDGLGSALAIAGLPSRPGLEGPVAGTFKIERSRGQIKLSSQSLRVAGIEAAGQVVTETSGESRRVSGSIRIDHGSVPGLLALFTAPTSTSRRATDRDSMWSEAPIDFALADRFAGSRIKIEAGRFTLTPGLEIASAALDVAVRPGGVDVRLADGKAVGGQAQGALVFEKVASSGARLGLQGTLTGLKLERLAPRGQAQPAIAGGLTVNLKLEGTALSPRGLVVGLSGGGEASLTQVRLNRWNPGAIAAAAEAIMAHKGELPPGALRTQLELALDTGGVSIGSPRLPITAADGALKLAPVSATVPNGRLTTRLALDLDHGGIDVDLKLEPRNSPQTAGLPPKPELPSVTVSYTGPVASLPALEPKIDLEALEREVTVRKVEREVAELERLRNTDQERVRQETERREAERRLGEQQRIEALSRPVEPGLSPGSAPPPAASAPSAQSSPSIDPPTAGTALPAAAGQGTPSSVDTPIRAEPPSTVERRPLTRPAPTRASPTTRRDPFSGN